MKNDIERRIFESGKLEIRRANSESKVSTIGGYAAKFNVLSEPMWGLREQIAPGAFDDVLDNDVRCFFNHDENLILGRTLAGTLRLSVDDVGLIYEADLPDTQVARDLVTSMERGDISQSSFAFRIGVNGDSWDENEDGVIIRTITKLGRLYDVSPVAIPAYPDATSAVRSLDEWKSQKEAEKSKNNAEIRKKLAEKGRFLRLISA